MLTPMRNILLILLLLPFVSNAQVKYSSESKKLYNKALKEISKLDENIKEK